MIESLRARWIIIFLVLAFAVLWTVPNFVNMENRWWPSKSKMVLGLDIQGGSHLVLRVDVDSAVKTDVSRMAAQLPNQLRDEKIETKSATVTDPLRGGMKIELADPAQTQAAVAYLDKFYGSTLRVNVSGDRTLDVEYGELYLRDFKTKLLDQAIAVIRNRIDEFGVAEPSITAQGSDRVLVQLPGIKDASQAKDLINRTARLDFMMVSKDMDPAALQPLIDEAEKTANLSLKDLKYSQYVDKLNAALKGKIPENTVVYFEKQEGADSMEVGRRPYLLGTTEVVTGDKLTNAQVSVDQYGKPIVSFQFDALGAKEFGDLTTKHVNEPMAIVLDKVVKSAPNIQSPITGGRGQITLGGGRDHNQTLNEAKVISTALRAGALPATLEQLEERTVGPSLGADAIRQGQIGALVASILVFVFMIIYYKSFGFVADLSLAFNVLITVAILSSLGATLTLPGVAGLALTLGISVDASVIVFERIKEEMDKGSTLRAAINEGYHRAFSAIIDSNLTSIAVCVVLYYFGTGPVRGFAVTLLTGLVITTFTAVFFTRAMIETMVNKWNMKLSVR
jgi:preprotein translocase subunit SecD